MLEIDSIWDSLLETFPYKAIVLKLITILFFIKFILAVLYTIICVKKDFLEVFTYDAEETKNRIIRDIIE